MPKGTRANPLTKAQKAQLKRINKRMKDSGQGPPFTQNDMKRRVRSDKRVSRKKK